MLSCNGKKALALFVAVGFCFSSFCGRTALSCKARKPRSQKRKCRNLRFADSRQNFFPYVYQVMESKKVRSEEQKK